MFFLDGWKKTRYTNVKSFEGGRTMTLTMKSWRWQMNELIKKADNMGQVRFFAV